MPSIKLAPSILSADQDIINQEIKLVEPFAGFIHVDIMDGKFVPQTTWTPEFVKTIKTKVPLDVHLMVENPSNEYLKSFIDAGASSISIHQETCTDLLQSINFIKKNKTKACVAINPHTPLSTIKQYLDLIDMVLIMTVEPGKAGQKFMTAPLKKVKELRKLKPNLDIEADGGINKETISTSYNAGANVFVAGSAIFKQEDRIQTIKDMLSQLK
tara:strand:+ start:140 stop:781 length:642 start_codon:yes stop_codon:yes gene_type:complete